ncbi:MAG: M20 family metallopeptidase [Thermomicrobiales bacterium]
MMKPLELLQRLIQFDSQTESPGESEITRFLVDYMGALGIETHLEEVEPGRYNAIGVWRGFGQGKSLMFNGHVDTNPVSEGWTVDPWAGTCDDIFIYGIGVSNMKAGCAAYLSAIQQLIHAGFQPRGDVILTFVIGELQNGVGTHQMLRNGWRSDYFVNCEPTDLQALTMHAGAFNFDVELVGETRHISKREDAVDAIAAACVVIPKFNALQFSGAESEEHQRINRCNVGVVRGALSREFREWRPPQIADFVRFSGTARFSPSQSMESVLGDMRDVLERLDKDFPGIKATVERQVKRENRPYFTPFAVDKDAEVVRYLNQAWREVRPGNQPTGAIEPCCFFGSDAAHLADAGIQGVVCGPGGKYNTMPDERVEIVDYLDAIEIYKKMTLQICGPGKEQSGHR